MTHDIRNEDWYRTAYAAACQRHPDDLDQLGSPQHLHFERVALRLLRLFPEATRGQVEAALLHDALEPGAGPPVDLAGLGVTDEAIRIIERITLPADGRTYLQYIADLAASGDIAAVQVKLADNLDATEVYSSRPTRAAQAMIEDTYNPSRRILQDALIRNAS